MLEEVALARHFILPVVFVAQSEDLEMKRSSHDDGCVVLPSFDRHTWILNGSRTIHTKTGQLSGGSVEEIEPADALLPLLISWHIKFRDEFLVVPNR